MVRTKRVGRERSAFVEAGERVRRAQARRRWLCASNRRASRLTTSARPPRPTDRVTRTAGIARCASQLDHERAQRRPQVKMLMRVEVRQRASRQRCAHRVELRVELAPEVGDIDSSGERARQEPPPRQRQPAVMVDQGRDLGRGQQRRVLADDGQVDADTELGSVVQQRRCTRRTRDRARVPTSR